MEEPRCISLPSVFITAALKQKAHCFHGSATREPALHCSARGVNVLGCEGAIWYLAVHEQVPDAPGKVLVLQLRVLVRDVLADPSELQDMTSIQIPGSKKKRKKDKSQNKRGSFGKIIRRKRNKDVVG